MYSWCSAPLRVRFKALKYSYAFDLKDTDHIIQPKKCSDCPLETSSKLVFLSHTCRTVFQCSVCSKFLKSKATLRHHTTHHHKLPAKQPNLKPGASKPSQLYKCNYCEKTYVQKYSCTVHMKDKHFVVENTEWHQCELCDFKGPYKHSVLRHITIVHKAEIKCEFCEYKTLKPSHMKIHLLNRHTEDKDINWFKCEFCDYKAKIKSYLNKHIGNQHEQSAIKTKRYKCDACGKVFKENTKLKWHIMLHHTSAENQDWHQCEQCDYKSLNKRQMRLHFLKKHSNEAKWHQCEFCHYKALHKSHLKSHMYFKHTKEEDIKWYKCDVCNYKTKVEALLKNHKNIVHSGVNCVECKWCDGLKFRYEVSLKTHIFRNHPTVVQELIKCLYCDYKHVLKSQVTRHIKRNHAQNPILYENCGEVPNESAGAQHVFIKSEI